MGGAISIRKRGLSKKCLKLKLLKMVNLLKKRSSIFIFKNCILGIFKEKCFKINLFKKLSLDYFLSSNFRDGMGIGCMTERNSSWGLSTGLTPTSG